MKIGRRKQILIAVLLVSQSLSWLWGRQGERRSAVGTKTLTQQLSELLEPVKVEVSPAAMAVPEEAATREVRIQWAAPTAPVNPEVPQALPPGPLPTGLFKISGQRRYPEAPARPRALELSPGHLFIAAVDRNDRLKSWSTIPDPRLVRAETPGPDGVLTGQTLYREQADFFVSLPDDPEIVELRFYQPQAEGAAYSLLSVGRVSIDPSR